MKSIDINQKILEEYKMKLFKELVKAVWYENIDEIDEIPIKVIGDNENNKFDKETTLNLMRVIMGLNPTDKFDYSLVDMLNEASNLS